MAKPPKEISLEEFMQGEDIANPAPDSKPDIRFGEDVSDVVTPLGDYSLDQTRNMEAIRRQRLKRNPKKEPSVVDKIKQFGSDVVDNYNNNIEGMGGYYESPDNSLPGYHPLNLVKEYVNEPIARAGQAVLSALDAVPRAVVGDEIMDDPVLQAFGLGEAGLVKGLLDVAKMNPRVQMLAP